VSGTVDARKRDEEDCTVYTLLLVILVLVLLGVVPTWPYSRSWGYGPSGIVGVLLVVLLIALFFGGGVAPRVP
jgi:Protein of unknown function (DUF3309)